VLYFIISYLVIVKVHSRLSKEMNRTCYPYTEVLYFIISYLVIVKVHSRLSKEMNRTCYPYTVKLCHNV
jgi:predicted aconitase